MYDFLFKTVLLGDEGVGKSTILASYNFDKLFKDIEPTIGVDFFTTLVHWNKKKIKLQVWDCAGNSSYQSIISSYFNTVVAAIIVFDLSNYNSFKNVENWINSFNKFSQKYSYILVVGNYIDGTVKVKDEEIRKLCNKYKTRYVQVNSSNVDSVKKMFLQLSEVILEENRLNPEWYRNNQGFKNTSNYTHFYNIDEHPPSKCCSCVIL